MATRRRVGPESFLQWISDITVTLVGSGLSDDQDWPVIRRVGSNEVVTTSTAVNASVLSDISYTELYAEQRAMRAYNVMLLDGGLLQMSYTFSNKGLMSHRLAFLPAPDLTAFQNDPELYLGEWLYADVVGSQASLVPLRFDYDARPGVAASLTHPAAHLTLGQYRHCRVPVSGPVSPAAFVDFVVRHFYSMPDIPALDFNQGFAGSFDVTITDEERTLVHVMTTGH